MGPTAPSEPDPPPANGGHLRPSTDWRRRSWSEFLRIARFAGVGVAATLAYIVGVVVASEAFALPPLAAACVGQAVSTAISYFGHLFVTFNVTPHHARRAPRFAVTVAITFALNLGLMALITHGFKLGYEVATGVIAIVIPLTNYLLGRYWVFSK